MSSRVRVINKTRATNKAVKKTVRKALKASGVVTSTPQPRRRKMGPRVPRQRMSAFSPLAAYRRVLADPFGSTPISLGLGASPSFVGTAYRRQIITVPAAGNTCNYLFATQPSLDIGMCPYFFNYAATDLITSSAIVQQFANQAQIAQVAKVFRPVACGVRLTIRTSALAVYPVLYGGHCPTITNICPDAAGTQWLTGQTYADTLNWGFSRISNNTTGTVTSVWVPSDSDDLDRYVKGPDINGANSSYHTTTVPYVGVYNMPKDSILEVESIFHFESTSGSIGASYFQMGNGKQSRYTAQELWSQYVKSGLLQTTSFSVAPTANIHLSSGDIKMGGVANVESKNADRTGNSPARSEVPDTRASKQPGSIDPLTYPARIVNEVNEAARDIAKYVFVHGGQQQPLQPDPIRGHHL